MRYYFHVREMKGKKMRAKYSVEKETNFYGRHIPVITVDAPMTTGRRIVKVVPCSFNGIYFLDWTWGTTRQLNKYLKTRDYETAWRAGWRKANAIRV